MNLQELERDLARVAAPPETLTLLLITAAAAAFVIAFRNFSLRIILRRIQHHGSKLRWRRNSAYLSFFVLVLVLFPLWLPSLRTVTAFLGLFGAGVLLVLKEVIVNLAGWFFIIFRRPFEIGNRISIGIQNGDVLDIRLMETSLIEVSSRDQGGQSTGRVIHVPNSFFFTQAFANASKEFAFTWNEIKIPITADSDWKKAISLVEKAAEQIVESISEKDSRLRHSEHEYAIRFQKITPRVYVDFRDGCIQLTLRHLVEPRTHRQIQDSFWRHLLEKISREKKVRLAGPLPGH